MKRIVYGLFLVLLLTHNGYAERMRLNKMQAVDAQQYDWQTPKRLMLGTDKLALLKQYGNLTFYKDYSLLSTGERSASELNADYSVGSAAATFTAAYTGKTSSWIDDNGVIRQHSGTDNMARVNGGYYDATGWHAYDSNSKRIKGLMVETAGANLITDSYMHRDSNSDGLSDSWSVQTNIAGTKTYSRVDATDLLNISGAYAQRVQFTGESGKYWLIENATVCAGVAGSSVTVSYYIKGSKGGATSFFIQLAQVDANGKGTADLSSSNITPTSAYSRVTYSTTLTDYARTITAFSDAGGGNVTATFSGGVYMFTGSLVTISGTTNYNGTYIVTANSGTQFTFADTWEGDDATGTATQATAGYKIRLRSADTLSGSWDFQFTAVQSEASPYATSFIPTTTASLSRPAETLSYLTSGNRTAAQDSVFIRMAAGSVFANDGVYRDIIDTSGGDGRFAKHTSGEIFGAAEGSSGFLWTTDVLANTSYVLAQIANGPTADINVNCYVNGVVEVNRNTNYSDVDFGTSMFFGSNSLGQINLNGIISNVAIFSDAKAAVPVASISTILASP